MKTLYLDLPMGAAGDMLSAALYELLNEEERKSFIEEINKAGIPGVTVAAESSVKCGITGTHFTVKVNGQEEESHDAHEHSHEHHHSEDHHHEHSHSHEHHHEEAWNSCKTNV